MPDNFDFLNDNKYEVGNIRNFLVSARINSERKTYSTVYHTVFALICSLLLYLAVDGDAIGFPGLICTLLLFALPSICAFTFLYGPMHAKILPVILPLLLFGIRLTFLGGNTPIYYSLVSLFPFMLIILSSAILTKGIISGYTKNTLFVALTVCYGLILVCEVCYIFISLTGSVSLTAVSDSIHSAFTQTAENTIQYFNSDPESMQLASMMYAEGEFSSEQFAESIRQMFEYTYSTIKAFLPSIVVIACMIYSFINIAVFSIVSRIFKIDTFVCIMDIKWTYRPSMLSTKIYDFACIAFILSMFINFPANISAAIINLFIILTPLMFVSSVRCFYLMLANKMNTKLAAGVIIAAVLLFASLFLGIMVMFFVSTIGVTFLRARDREEKLFMPAKIASDIEIFNRAFAKTGKNTSEQAPISDQDNTTDAQ